MEVTDGTMSQTFGFVGKIRLSHKRRTKYHRPLAGLRISNPVSVITAAETKRRERERGKKRRNWRESSNLRQLAGRFRSDPFSESRLSNVNFGRRCWIPDIYGYVPFLTHIDSRRKGLSQIFSFAHSSRDHPIVSSTKARFRRKRRLVLLIIVERILIDSSLINCIWKLSYNRYNKVKIYFYHISLIIHHIRASLIPYRYQFSALIIRKNIFLNIPTISTLQGYLAYDARGK